MLWVDPQSSFSSTIAGWGYTHSTRLGSYEFKILCKKYKFYIIILNRAALFTVYVSDYHSPHVLTKRVRL